MKNVVFCRDKSLGPIAVIDNECRGGERVNWSDVSGGGTFAVLIDGKLTEPQQKEFIAYMNEDVTDSKCCGVAVLGMDVSSWTKTKAVIRSFTDREAAINWLKGNLQYRDL